MLHYACLFYVDDNVCSPARPNDISGQLDEANGRGIVGCAVALAARLNEV